MKHNYFTYAVVIFLLAMSHQFCYSTNTVDTEKLDNRHFTIVAFLPIHYGGYKLIPDIDHCCTGRINDEVIPTLEALYIARDEIIKHDRILPANISLKIEVKDYCGFAGLGTLQMSKLLLQDYCWFDEWTETMQKPPTCFGTETPSHLLGIIYGNDSVTSDFKNFLQSFSVPSISYSSPQMEIFDEDPGAIIFNNTGKNRTFNAIASGSTFTADIIFEIMKNRTWTLAALHYSHKDSGIGNRFAKRFNEKNKNNTIICLTINNSFDDLKNNSNTRDTDAPKPIPPYHENVDVIICLCKDDDIIELGRILQTYNRSKRYTIIAGYQEILSKYLTENWKSDYGNLYYVTPQQSLDGAFKEYYLTLWAKNNASNPEFKKFWEQHFNCTFSPENQISETICNGSIILRNEYQEFNDKYDEQNPDIANIMKSVYALAFGLQETLVNSSNHNLKNLQFMHNLVNIPIDYN